jgi:HEAT repeat protein
MAAVVFPDDGKQMTYFCTACWEEIDKHRAVCPHCGGNQQELGGEPFVQKLIRALRHPEPETATRAARILGQLKAVDAIRELEAIMTTHFDPYIAAECARAVGEIGDPRIIKALQELLRQPVPLVVRYAALEALEKLRNAQPRYE